MTKSVKLFSKEFTNWIMNISGFKKSQYQMSIYHRYAPNGPTLVVLSHVDDFLFRYTSEELGKWFWDTLVKRFHVNFLGYSRWFVSIGISQLKNHSILVYQARYSTAAVLKYLDTVTIK